MFLSGDASDHEWIPDHRWDLVVTMDDATGEHLSMFFCDPARHGIELPRHRPDDSLPRVIQRALHRLGQPLFLHAGGGRQGGQDPLDPGGARAQTTGHRTHRCMAPPPSLHSPRSARGRSERAFRTHQGRLPQELAKVGVTDMASANRYLEQTIWRGIMPSSV